MKRRSTSVPKCSRCDAKTLRKSGICPACQEGIDKQVARAREYAREDAERNADSTATLAKPMARYLTASVLAAIAATK